VAKEISFNEFCKFQDKQLEADRAVNNFTYTFYGGAAGGGKSYFLRWEGIKLLLRYYKKYRLKGVRIGLFCEDYPALRERHLSKIQYEFPRELGVLNKSDHEFILNDECGGGVLAFRNLDDPSKYLSSEFASTLVDELTKNPRETFDFLNMRRRWPGIPDTKFIGASNPGGIGHGFVKKLWIDRDFSDESLDPKEFVFIRARVEDNTYLGQEYIRTLEQLPEKLRKAYREGSWDIFAGQYFTEWSSERHVCEYFEIPSGWTKIRCLDYGYAKPSAVYWLAVDYDGNVYVYRELYGVGYTYKTLAEEIVNMTPEDEVIDYTVADTSVFDKSPDTGKDGDDTFAENGVPITSANKERIIGWNLFRDYLLQGKIVFFENCVNAIRTIPALVYNDIAKGLKVEDLDSAGEDHAADAIRYGLMSLPPLPILKAQGEVNIYQNIVG
jgi:phage terminase large subunit